MCIIVISEKKPLELASFEDFAKFNQDGAGIMVARNGKVHTHVTLDGPKAVHAKYLELYRQGDPMFLHYRMKTHGAIDLANTHPYLVYRHEDGKELWMMHNGVLRMGNAKNPQMSDTWNFIQQRLQSLTKDFPKWFMNEDLVQWLGDFIGNNRFVFLDSDGDYNIVNAQQWSMHDEHCYSNEYAWSAPKKVYVTNPYPKYTPPVGNQVSARRGADWLWDDDDEQYWNASCNGYKALDHGNVSTDDVVENETEAASILYQYYDDFARQINAALPEGAVKGWTPQIVVQLEEYMALSWFTDFLDTQAYSADECDTLMKVLDVGDATEMTIEADELIEDILYGRPTVAETKVPMSTVYGANGAVTTVPATVHTANGKELKVLK